MVLLLYHKRHKINFNLGGSYKESRDWIKKKIATINPKKKDNKCFQYPETIALNFDEIKKDPQKISNIEPFTNDIFWDGIKYPSNRNMPGLYFKN